MALTKIIRNGLTDLIETFRLQNHVAAWADDEGDSLIVNAPIDDVVEVLDADRWTLEDARQDIAGTVHSSKIVIMSGGPFDLKLLQAGNLRTLIVAEAKDPKVVTDLSMTGDRVFATDEDEFPIGTPRLPGMGIERYVEPTLMSMGKVMARLQATKRGK